MLNPEADLKRFSKLHAWYNHLPPDGTAYLIFPWRGQQPKTHFDPQVEDNAAMHWWAWDARDINEIPLHGVAKDIIMRHPVYFNCCLRGIEDGGFLSGFANIEKKYPDFELHLRGEYQYVKSLEKIFALESTRQLKKAEYTAHLVTVLFEEQCPVWLNANEERADELRRSGGDDDQAATLCAKTPPTARRHGLFRRTKSARNVH